MKNAPTINVNLPKTRGGHGEAGQWRRGVPGAALPASAMMRPDGKMEKTLANIPSSQRLEPVSPRARKWQTPPMTGAAQANPRGCPREAGLDLPLTRQPSKVRRPPKPACRDGTGPPRDHEVCGPRPFRGCSANQGAAAANSDHRGVKTAPSGPLPGRRQTGEVRVRGASAGVLGEVRTNAATRDELHTNSWQRAEAALRPGNAPDCFRRPGQCAAATAAATSASAGGATKKEIFSRSVPGLRRWRSRYDWAPFPVPAGAALEATPGAASASDAASTSFSAAAPGETGPVTPTSTDGAAPASLPAEATGAATAASHAAAAPGAAAAAVSAAGPGAAGAAPAPTPGAGAASAPAQGPASSPGSPTAASARQTETISPKPIIGSTVAYSRRRVAWSDTGRPAGGPTFRQGRQRPFFYGFLFSVFGKKQ
jgi:hypothetical protein